MDRQNAAVRQKQPPHSRATFMIRSCSLIRTSSTLVLFLVPLPWSISQAPAKGYGFRTNSTSENASRPVFFHESFWKRRCAPQNKAPFNSIVGTANKKSRPSRAVHAKSSFFRSYSEALPVIPAGLLRSPGCARRSARRRSPPERPAACPWPSAGRGRSDEWWSWAPWPGRRTGSRSPSPPEP